MVKRKRSSLTAEERVSQQLHHLTSQLGFLSMQGLMSEVEALMPAIGQLKTLASAPQARSNGPRVLSTASTRPQGTLHEQRDTSIQPGSAALPAQGLWNCQLQGPEHDVLAFSAAPGSVQSREDGTRRRRPVRLPGMAHLRGDNSSRDVVHTNVQRVTAATSDRQAHADAVKHINWSFPGQKSSAGRQGTPNNLQHRASDMDLPHCGSKSEGINVRATALPQPRQALLAERRLGSTVSSAAARIWRKCEADRCRRHGVDQAAADPARHRRLAATIAPQLHRNPLPMLSKDKSLQTHGCPLHQAQIHAPHERCQRLDGDSIPVQAAAASRVQHVASVDTASRAIASMPVQQCHAGHDPAGYGHRDAIMANSSDANEMTPTEVPGASTAVQDKESDGCLNTKFAQQVNHSIQAFQGPISPQRIPLNAAEEGKPASLGLTDGANNSYRTPCLVLSRMVRGATLMYTMQAMHLTNRRNGVCLDTCLVMQRT